MIETSYFVEVRDQRDALAERVRRLESVLFDTLWTPRDWGLTHHEGVILNTLALRRLASRSVLYDALYGLQHDVGPEPKTIDVHLVRLRKKVRPYGIEILTARGQGWCVDDATRIWLCQLWKAAA